MNPTALTQRLLRLLYFAFTASVVFYFFIGELLGARARSVSEITMLRNVLWLAGATATGIVLLFRYRLMPPLPALPPSRDELARLLARWRAGYITSFALAESVAIFGLVLRLLGGALNDALPCYVAAAVLFALLYPRLPQSYTS